MGKLSPNHAQLFLRNKYSTVFTMGGTVALRTLPKVDDFYCINELTDHGKGGQVTWLLCPVL